MKMGTSIILIQVELDKTKTWMSLMLRACKVSHCLKFTTAVMCSSMYIIVLSSLLLRFNFKELIHFKLFMVHIVYIYIVHMGLVVKV